MNQINQINKTNQINQMDQARGRVACAEELRGFCQQDARDLEVGEDHFRGSIESLVVGALESVALDRRAGQGAHLCHKVFDIFMGDVKRVVVQELIDPEQQIQHGAEPCEPGIVEHQLDELVRRADAAVDAFVGELFRHNQRAIERQEFLVYLQHGEAQMVSVGSWIGWWQRSHTVSVAGPQARSVWSIWFVLFIWLISLLSG